MKKSVIDKIEKEINEKTKLPNEVKEKIKKEVFTNIAVASVIILYLIFIILGSVGSVKNVRAIDLNIFSIIFLGMTIFLFEVAYRKDDGKLAIYGIESLIVAIFTLFLPYIIFELNKTDKKYYLMASIYIASYYILKSIVIAIKTKNKYMNSNISDIKEIVKKEKTKRRIKEDIEEVEEVIEKTTTKKAATKKETTKKEPVKKIPTKKTASKAETKTKKETTTKSSKENDKNESAPKKRGRPRKTETAKSEDKPKEEITPKKRGRPRKVAISND